jgi:hypothetical protein
MSESATNLRRHGSDLPIRDKDLMTGKDVRRIVAYECERERERTQLFVERSITDAMQEERDRLARVAAEAHAAVWYRRLWRKVRP